jgi:hypothetical protein
VVSQVQEMNWSSVTTVAISNSTVTASCLRGRLLHYVRHFGLLVLMQFLCVGIQFFKTDACIP